MLTVWVIAFTLLVAWSLQIQRSESRRNDQRFCDVTSSYIASNLALREAQNQASVEAIGQRTELIQVTHEIIRFLSLPPAQRRTASQSAFNKALIRWLTMQNTLNERLNAGAISTLNAADIASAEWAMLKKRLRCR